jgi:HemY protein
VSWRLRKNPAFLTSYVKQLQHYPQVADIAVKLIQKSLKKSYQASLVRMYGLLPSEQPLKQLIQAEKWLNKYPHESVLLLTLGRLAMRCELWGKARRYFTDSLALEKNPEAYAEQGKLLEQLGEANAALRSYRAGSDLQWEQGMP